MSFEFDRDPWFPALESPKTQTLRALRRSANDERSLLVDSTMLYAPRSGGVKRYLNAKRAWIRGERPDVRHTLVVPGERSEAKDGLVTIHAARLPFGDGYRWPQSVAKWADFLETLSPSVIEAGDIYTPGLAAIEAGQRLGVPVVGFCHSDPASLAALHFGEWAKKPVEKRWSRTFKQFDRVVAPSQFIANRLLEAGVQDVVCRPLGVDVDTFRPDRRDRAALLRRLGLSPDKRLLVFAGRPAREKNIDVMIDAVNRLGDPYVLLLVGAGAFCQPTERVLCLDYERDPKGLAKVLASCDAFVHANHREPFGLIVLEAMACGLPVVGVRAGGVAETVNEQVGQFAHSTDPAHFAEAIDALFERDLPTISAAARSHTVRRFAWDRVFTDLCEVYAELTGDPAFSEPVKSLARVH